MSVRVFADMLSQPARAVTIFCCAAHIPHQVIRISSEIPLLSLQPVHNVSLTQVLFSLTVNSGQEDTGELVSVARVLRDAGRVRGPDTETRRGLVNNIVNVCANLEGKEVSGHLC